MEKLPSAPVVALPRAVGVPVAAWYSVTVMPGRGMTEAVPPDWTVPARVWLAMGVGGEGRGETWTATNPPPAHDGAFAVALATFVLPEACRGAGTAYAASAPASTYRVHTAQSLPDAASVQPAPGDQLPGPIFIARLPFTMAA
jgi:hypothetical protein